MVEGNFCRARTLRMRHGSGEGLKNVLSEDLRGPQRSSDLEFSEDLRGPQRSSGNIFFEYSIWEQ